MDHADWIGISVLISSVTSSIVALLAAYQSLKNRTTIKDVQMQVNGVTDRLVEQSHKAGVLEGATSMIVCEKSKPNDK